MGDLGPHVIRIAEIRGDEEIKKLKERKRNFSADRTGLIGFLLALLLLLAVAWLIL